MGEPLADEGVLESLIILGLVAAIMLLMYYRARRQEAHRQAQEDAARQQNNGGAQPQAQPQQAGGIFPAFGGAGFNAQWGAGGVGH
jgi:SEL1 protein